MRKIVICLFVGIFLFISSTQAQDIKRKIGVGLQYSLPIFGLSVKYGITESSVLQATIAPFGVGASGDNASINFYGARYIHRFPGSSRTTTVLDPYLFAGVGLINYKYSSSYYGDESSSETIFSYSVGGGLELIVANSLGLSAEIGYGRVSFTGLAVNTIVIGAGIHYYLR